MARHPEFPNLVVSENFAAGEMEHALGIKFEQKPHRVMLSVRNMRALRRDYPSLNDDFKRLQDGFVGAYHSEFNTYVLKNNLHYDYWLFAERHENMHGWVAQENPEYYKKHEATILDLKRKDWDAATDEEKERAVKAMEAPLVAMTVGEGLAQWGAIEGGYTLDKNKPYIWTPNTVHEAHTTEIQQRLSQTSPEGVKIGSRGVEFNRQSLYGIGHSFVFNCMQVMQALGMSNEEGLRSIAQNPPDKLSMISEQSGFIDYLTEAKILKAPPTTLVISEAEAAELLKQAQGTQSGSFSVLRQGFRFDKH